MALALTLPVFLGVMGGHLIPAIHHWIMGTLGETTSWWVQFVLTALVLAVLLLGLAVLQRRRARQRSQEHLERAVALRRPDESGKDQVLLALIAARAVQPVQQGRRIPERCEGSLRTPDGVETALEVKLGR